MRTAALVLILVIGGCSSSGEFRVTSYKQVNGTEAAPWPSGCLAVIENPNQKVVGLNGTPCEHIQIGDKAVFNHSGDTVFWINDQPYNVRMAQAK